MSGGCTLRHPPLMDVARRGYGYFVITIRGNTSNFIGPCLLFLGMFLMTVAIVVPLALVPRLKVVPLDLDITTVATSNPAGLTSNDEGLPPVWLTSDL